MRMLRAWLYVGLLALALGVAAVQPSCTLFKTAATQPAVGVGVGKNISGAGATVEAAAPLGGPAAGIIALVGAAIMALGNGVQWYYNGKLKFQKVGITDIATQAIGVATNVIQSVEAAKKAGLALTPAVTTALSATQTDLTKDTVDAVQQGTVPALAANLSALTK